MSGQRDYNAGVVLLHTPVLTPEERARQYAEKVRQMLLIAETQAPNALTFFTMGISKDVMAEIDTCCERVGIDRPTFIVFAMHFFLEFLEETWDVDERDLEKILGME
jgi:hypothetical protein